MADASKHTSTKYNIRQTTKNEFETNFDLKANANGTKRKAVALLGESHAGDITPIYPHLQSLRKIQKHGEIENIFVADDDGKKNRRNRNEDPNGDERDMKLKRISKHYPSSQKYRSDFKEENDILVTDKDVEDTVSDIFLNNVNNDEVAANGVDGDETKKKDNYIRGLLNVSKNNRRTPDMSTHNAFKNRAPYDAQSSYSGGKMFVDNSPDTQLKDRCCNPYDCLKYDIVRNDGKPESLIKLVALKSLFSRQLPKMPRTYIARLVFDRKHTALVILNDDPATKNTDEEVIGSICYRPFYDMCFAEIAFCAVNASHQVKGYGTKLMNLIKQEGARTGIEYFITYADNYAIGYFKKQGFTKNITMPKGRYQGLIKEYDGGTMMECYVHPSVDFTYISETLSAQRKIILNRIKLKALSHSDVYDPLPKNWNPHLEGISRANESAARALAVPGMVEAGWTMADLITTTGQGKDSDRAKNALKSELMSIIRKVEDQQFAWPFREPVDTNEVKDYLDIIKEPIDLLTIDKRIRKGDHYKSKKMLYADLVLMVNNCKLYNDETSTYVQCAMNLERFLTTLFT